MTTSPVTQPGAATRRRSRSAGLPRRRPAGFSLIEVLLAIFILGVGVISISALFPAGIAQQRLSVDEIMGPTVANNAISILRNKLSSDDFGAIESFAGGYVSKTIAGDWPWLRPAVLIADDPATANFDERGVLDIFSAGMPNNALATEFGPPTNPSGFPGSNPAMFGIPYNGAKYFNQATGVPVAPRVTISQGDRYFPMRSSAYLPVPPAAAPDPARPQYVWDCMFRRFGGKIYVAIFVYRATQPGGGPAINYTVAKNLSNARVPPLPVSLDLTLPATQADVCINGVWGVGGFDGDPGSNAAKVADNAIIRGMKGGVPYNPADARHAWQEPRQWLLDNNMNVHRVLGQSRSNNDPARYMDVELVRPLAMVPGRYAPTGGAATGTPYEYTALAGSLFPGQANRGVVKKLWYVPLTDSNGMTLTPVYLTVKEL